MNNHNQSEMFDYSHDYAAGGIAFTGFSLLGLAAGIGQGSIHKSLMVGAASIIAGFGIGFIAMALLARRR